MRERLAMAAVVLGLVGIADAARATALQSPPLAAERDAPAFCLRTTGGAGDLSIARPRGRTGVRLGTGLLSAGESGLARVGRTPLATEDCAAVATAANGAAVAAGAVFDRGRRESVVRAALRDAGGRFGPPATVGPSGDRVTPIAAAVAPDGTAVVAWLQGREGKRPGTDSESRVMVARRPPGRRFTRARALTGWTPVLFAGPGHVVAGVDRAGGAVVAWSVPSGRADEITGLGRVAAVRAAPGAGFGTPQVLADRMRDTERLTLAVAPDGRALLAFDGDGAVRTFEAAPEAAFAAGPVLGEGDDRLAEAPAVALREGGGAVIAWRAGEGDRTGAVSVMSRESAGAFGPARALTRPAQDVEALGISVFLVTPGGSIGGAENSGPHAAVAPDGRVVVTWVDPRAAPDGDVVPAARLAFGTLSGGLGVPEWLGTRCRAANATAALLLEGGEPGAAFTDNQSTAPVSRRGESEFPSGRGRVHLAVDRLFAPALDLPPRIKLRARPQTLFFDEPIEVRATCDAPCDLRALPLSGPGLGTAALRRAGTVTLRIEPSAGRHLAPRRPGRVRVAVHACNRAGGALSTARISVPVRRRRPPPVPRIVGLRAQRRGNAVRVSWRTTRPARRLAFDVEGMGGRPRRTLADRVFEGRGRTRFAVRLRGRAIRVVRLRAFARDPGGRRITRRVRVR